jgi:7-cyano-7-deazaguanine synthase in queuosine biosynthesis
MTPEHVVHCGPALGRARRVRDPNVVRLEMGKGPGQIHLKISDIARPLAASVPDSVADLVEVATYVYCADQRFSRGGKAEFDYGDKWHRHFCFRIPVREPEVWGRPGLRDALKETLGFLSDDTVELEFVQHPRPARFDDYLFGDRRGDPTGIEEVMLFSGGLDSLAGAVQEILVGRRKVALVSHRSTSKIGPTQRHLVRELSQRLADKSHSPLHLPVTINKGKRLAHEYTQRTRSFLFVAIGAAVARLLGRDRVRFYENGVVSMNLPLTLHALGGRASRTTHPRVLDGFTRILSELFGTTFTVENPFLLRTKADCLGHLKHLGQADLCATTISCAHTWERTKHHTHCGRCSQCVDRRLVAIAAGLSDREDPPEMYKCDVLTAPRERIQEQTLIERYAGNARRVRDMASPAQFFGEFGEAARLLRHLDVPPATAAEKIFQLHKRHAEQICAAIETEAASRRNDAARIPGTSLLGIVGLGPVEPRPCRDAAPPGTPVPDDAPGSNGTLVTVDRSTFSVRCGAAVCSLKNTVEFRLLEFLARRPTFNRPIAELLTAAWDGQVRGKNTVQKTASNLNRTLRASGITGLTVDGSNRGHYFLRLTEGRSITIQRNPSDTSNDQ